MARGFGLLEAIERFQAFLGWMADSWSEEENEPRTSCCAGIQETLRMWGCSLLEYNYWKSVNGQR